MNDDEQWAARLRETLHGPVEPGQVDSDAFLADVHSGARSRRRRQYAGAAAAVAVIAGGGVAVGTLADFGEPSRDIAERPGHTTSVTGSGEPSTPNSAPPSTTVTTGGNVAQDGSRVVSITSTGNEHQWALVKSDGCEHDACGTLFTRDVDSGDWTAVGAPLPWPVDNGTGDLDQVSEVRFVGDAENGYDAYAFGPGILSAHSLESAAETVEWQPSRGYPGGYVLSLEARADTVYALVNDGEAMIDLVESPTDADDWKLVPGLDLQTTRDLVVSDGVVAFLSTGADGSTFDVVSSPADSTTGRALGDWATTTPCGAGGSVALTSAANSLWVLCADGSVATAVVDSGALDWQSLGGQFSRDAVLTARSTTSAVVADTDGFTGLNVNGAFTDLSPEDFSDATMIGFTNDSLGFAVLHGELYRTTDGGESWEPEQVAPTQ